MKSSMLTLHVPAMAFDSRGRRSDMLASKLDLLHSHPSRRLSMLLDPWGQESRPHSAPTRLAVDSSVPTRRAMEDQFKEVTKRTRRQRLASNSLGRSMSSPELSQASQSSAVGGGVSHTRFTGRHPVAQDMRIPSSKKLYPSDLDFRDLTSGRRNACRIDRTEHRGIMVGQVRALLDFIKKFSNHCSGAIRGWHSLKTDQQLYIQAIDLYDVVEWIIKPVTQEACCSYVEAVMFSEDAQRPAWFVSHWWGEAVVDFYKALTKHAHVRGDMVGLVKSGHAGNDMCCVTSSYWVCAYANNQHELGLEIDENPLETSFFRALTVCRGVLAILDGFGPATAFKRIWCMFELAVVVMDTVGDQRKVLLDVVAVKEGVAHLVTDGLTEKESRMENDHQINSRKVSGWTAKVRREKGFPVEIMREGLQVQIHEAEASKAVDRKRILNALIAQADSDLDQPRDLNSEPPRSHHRYDDIDARIRAVFANAALREAVQQDVDITDGGPLPLCKALRADSDPRSLQLDLGGCFRLTDAGLDVISTSLPNNLQKLVLNLQQCHQITSFEQLASQVCKMEELKEVTIDCGDCDGLSDDSSIDQLTAQLSKLPRLRKLALNFKGCQQLRRTRVVENAFKTFDGRSNFTLSVSDANGKKLAVAAPPPQATAAEETQLAQKKFTFSGWTREDKKNQADRRKSRVV